MEEVDWRTGLAMDNVVGEKEEAYGGCPRQQRRRVGPVVLLKRQSWPRKIKQMFATKFNAQSSARRGQASDRP